MYKNKGRMFEDLKKKMKLWRVKESSREKKRAENKIRQKKLWEK